MSNPSNYRFFAWGNSVLTMLFPRPIHSMKNKRRLVKVDGKMRSVKSDVARKDGNAFRMMAITRRKRTVPLANDVRVEIAYSMEQDAILVEVFDLGPAVTVERIKPDKLGRKRKTDGRHFDLHGMLETAADYLQGVAYEDDKQVAEVVLYRQKERFPSIFEDVREASSQSCSDASPPPRNA